MSVKTDESTYEKEDMMEETTKKGFEKKKKKKKIHDLMKAVNVVVKNCAEVKFTLNEPGTFTAQYESGKFSKVSLLGFEVFTLSKIYISKRQKPILCFAPAEVSKFAHIELPITQANKCFSELAQYLNDTEILSVLKEIDELLNEDAAAVEFKTKAEQYDSIGWGAW